MVGHSSSPSSLNRCAVVADQADVLNLADVNDRSNSRIPWTEICHEIDARRDIDDRGHGDFRPGADDGAVHGGRQAKAGATIPIRPALQTPADTANAMAQAERQAIQSDLAWIGEYNGAINGEVSERMVAAIKEFQKDRGGKQTGVLNPQERGVLAETAKKRQENVGWKIVTDAGTGARLGIPTKLVPQQSSDANGTKWSSSTGTIQIQLTRRKEANPTTAKLAEQEKKEPPDARSNTPWSSRISSCCRACRD